MATVPSTFVFSAGSVLPAATLNTYLSNAVAFFLAVPVFEGRQTVAQSLANTPTLNVISLDTEDVDNDNGHSTSTNTSRYTAQTAGRFQLSGGVGFASNATGARQAVWVVNGSAISASVSQWAPPSGIVMGVPTRVKTTFLNVGDYVELGAIQASGGALNTDVSVNTTQSGVSVRWVGTT